MSNPLPPGLRDQAGVRITLRVVGVVLLVVSLVFIAIGLTDFFGSMNSTDFGGPDKFWMLFVGIPLLSAAMWCLRAGFLGTAARYTAGETMPVVRDSASYLTDGKGFLGIGKTDDDEQAPTQASAASTSTHGPYCSHCGTRNDDGAKYCDNCGAALA